VGVVVFSAVFITLTVNTMQYMPVSTNEHALTMQVVAGKKVWQSHDCTGCHTLLGNGAYYAPDLTRVHPVRGAAFLASWLAAPLGQMPNQKLTAQQVRDLTAFLAWVSQIDTNGWPPAAIAAQAGTGVDTAATQGRALFQASGCAGCHGTDGEGTATAPSLIDVSQRLDDAYLTRWLENPATVKPGATMPALGLTVDQIKFLLAYLHTLD